MRKLLTGKAAEDLGTGPRGVHKHANHDLGVFFLVLTETAKVGTEGGTCLTEFLAKRLGGEADSGSRGVHLVASRTVSPVHLLVLAADSGAGRDGCKARVGANVGRLSESVTDHLGRKEKVVVVHDDQVSWAVDLCDLAGEKAVGGVVVNPRRVRRRDGCGGIEPEEVVEQRPERWDGQLGSRRADDSLVLQ